MKISFKKIISSVMLLSLACFTFGFVGIKIALADGPAVVNLGSLQTNNFVIFGQTGVTDANPTITSVTGNIGTSLVANPAITGLSCTEVLGGGKIYILTTAGYAGGHDSNISCLLKNDAIVPAAVGDFTTAYNDAIAVKTPAIDELDGGTLGTQTLASGTYRWAASNITITGDITLAGGADDVWIFQTTGNLSIQNGKKIILSGGAQAKNIFWVVAGHTELFDGSTFVGNILGWSYIAMDAGATLDGRALSKTQVTLIGNNISTTDSVIDIDNNPPVITLNGVTPNITVGGTYTELGATATDDVDPPFPATSSGSVDTSKVGSYIITYNATDSYGNVAIPVTRTVNVIARRSSGGSSAGGIHYGCKDINAINYELFSASKPSLCEYATITSSTSVSTTTLAMIALLKSPITNIPSLPNTGFPPEESMFSNFISSVLNILSL